jgi:hypothetical protein
MVISSVCGKESTWPIAMKRESQETGAVTWFGCFVLMIVRRTCSLQGCPSLWHWLCIHCLGHEYVTLAQRWTACPLM